MSGRRFDLNDYVDVQERIHWFWKTYPDGRIETQVIHAKDDFILMKASVWRDRNLDIEKPCATGHAFEMRDGTRGPNSTHHIENCETSSIGRALANLNFVASKSFAKKHQIHGAPEGSGPEPWDRGKDAPPRPSRQEMEKAAPPPPPPSGDPLDSVCQFRKHAGKTWREVLREDPEYVRWSVANNRNLDQGIREALGEALELLADPFTLAGEEVDFDY